MRLLADESCGRRLVAGLRALGHDVRELDQEELGSLDTRVLELSCTERRILLTEDKDFGELVFASGLRAAGVILVRAKIGVRSALVQEVNALLAQGGDPLHGCFVVVEPGRVRVVPVGTWR